MGTVFYVSSEKLQVIRGGRGLTVQACGEVSLPENTVVNGTVTDEGKFLSALAQLRRENPSISMKKVTLLIGGSQVMLKTLAAPEVNRRLLLEWGESEFSDTPEELCVDYCAAPAAEGVRQVTLYAARKELLLQYGELLKNAGIQPQRITFIQDALMGLASRLPELKESCVLLSFDGNALDASLFSDGEYRFSNRVRMLSEPGSRECAEEAERTVSSMLQFSRTPVRRVLVLGEEPWLPELIRRLREDLEVTAGVLEDASGAVKGCRGYSLAGYAVITGALAGKMDLLPALRKATARKREVSGWTLAWVGLGLFAAVLLGVWGMLLGSLNGKNARLQALDERITQLSEEYDYALTLEAQSSSRSEDASAMETEAALPEGYPPMDTAFYTVLDKCTSGYIVSSYDYDGDTRLLRMTVSAGSVEDMPALAERLRSCGSFTTVYYTGYTSDAEGSYTCVVSCLLKLPEADMEDGNE